MQALRGPTHAIIAQAATRDAKPADAAAQTKTAR